MREHVYKMLVSNVRVEVICLEEAFRMQRLAGGDVMSQINHIHRHSTYEIFFVSDGTLSVATEQGVGEYENSAVIIPPSYNHYTVSKVKNGYCFYFTLAQVEKPFGHRFCQIENKLSVGIAALALDDELRFYITQFAQRADRHCGGEELTHLLFLLFHRLFEKLDPPLEESENDTANLKPNKYIHRIDAYIVSKKRDVTLEELARVLYLSPKQVSRIIRKEYGCSFPALLNQRKLTTACMLLKYTDLPITQIATEVGYAYENYFFSQFKGAYGVTPLQYRRQNKS